MSLNFDRKMTIFIDNLGEVELKYVSVGDIIEFAELIQNQIPDRLFVAKVLLHQIIAPPIELDAVHQLPDPQLLTLARAFIGFENHTFEYFVESSDFFSNFKQALVARIEKDNQEYRSSLKGIVSSLTSTQEILNVFSSNYAPMIQQVIDRASFIHGLTDQVNQMVNSVINTQYHLSQIDLSAIFQTTAITRTVLQSLGSQIDFWQKWAEQNQGIFENFGRFWSQFYSRYSIAESEATQVLRKYNWFISPSLPLQFVYEVVAIGRLPGRQDKAVNALFVNYFKENNWRNLELMVRSWRQNKVLRRRYRILSDCVAVVKLADAKRTNASNTILPTLITQIDGAMSDFLELNGITWQREYEDEINPKTGELKKAGRKSLIKNSRPKVLSTLLDELATDIFLNILFHTSYRQKPDGEKPKDLPLNFNRHKIIHGENVRYGRRDYLVRAFLVLDLIAHWAEPRKITKQ